MTDSGLVKRLFRVGLLFPLFWVLQFVKGVCKSLEPFQIKCGDYVSDTRKRWFCTALGKRKNATRCAYHITILHVCSWRKTLQQQQQIAVPESHRFWDVSPLYRWSIHNISCMDIDDIWWYKYVKGMWASRVSPVTFQDLCLAENYVSPRLLRGVVPSVLLENYSFWEGEELRGANRGDAILDPKIGKVVDMILWTHTWGCSDNCLCFSFLISCRRSALNVAGWTVPVRIDWFTWFATNTLPYPSQSWPEAHILLDKVAIPSHGKGIRLYEFKPLRVQLKAFYGGWHCELSIRHVVGDVFFAPWAMSE